MKALSVFHLLAAVFFFELLTQISYGQTVTRPQYPLKFRYTNPAGVVKDTILNRQAYKFWSKSADYPNYVKWKNLPFAVLRSPLNGVGLFTDSAKAFNTGDTIGLIYYKMGAVNRFDADYAPTNLWAFLNDADTPNAQAVITPQGLVIIALQTVPGTTEITVSYQSILNLFPGDQTAVRLIQYW